MTRTTTQGNPMASRLLRALLFLVILGMATVACEKRGQVHGTSPEASPPTLSGDGGASEGASGGAAVSSAPRTILAWVLGDRASLASLDQNADTVTTLSPTYFRIAVKNGATKLEDWDPGLPIARSKMERVARQKGLELVPLVGCIGPCGVAITPILADGKKRKAHVAQLLAAAERERVAGLLIDYEDVAGDASAFTAFAQELAEGLHRTHRKLAFALAEPCGRDPQCRREPYPFDLRALAEVADELILMEYDYAVFGEAPIAPKAWVKLGLDNAKQRMGPQWPQKLVVALPFYGRLQQGLTRDTAVLWTEVAAAKVQGSALKLGAPWLDTEGLSKVSDVEVVGTKKRGKLFFEDHETLAVRLDLLDTWGFHRVAFWRLGGEDPCNWEVLRRFRRGENPKGASCGKAERVPTTKAP